MTHGGCKKNLPDKPGGKVKGHGKVIRIRTKKIGPNKYAHVRVMSKEGSREGRTLMGDVMTKKTEKRKKKKRRLMG